MQYCRVKVDGTMAHIGVLFRLVWLEMDGTGLDGVYSTTRAIYFSERPPMTYDCTIPLFWFNDPLRLPT